MGSLFSKSKKEEPPKPTKPKVAVNESELAIAKAKLYTDRLEGRLKKLEKDDASVDSKIRAMVAAKKKEEAYFFLKQKKTIREAMKGTNQKLDFVHKQIETMESAIDDAKFTNILKDSNKAIESLSKEIDLDEIRVAKELQQEGKMRREELDQLLDDDDEDDQEIKRELDNMEKQMIDDEFSKHTSTPIKEADKTQSNKRVEEQSENRGQLLTN